MGGWGDGVIMKKALCTLLAVSVYYNPNGSKAGFGSGGQFATLTNIPFLEAEDFVLRV